MRDAYDVMIDGLYESDALQGYFVLFSRLNCSEFRLIIQQWFFRDCLMPIFHLTSSHRTLIAV